jgi:N-acetylglucosamine-6-phosphate deacetylase
MPLLAGARVVAPGGVLDPGWVRVEGERIAAFGPGSPAEAGEPAQELAGRWLVPGFVDQHVHGGGGAAYTTGDPDEARAAAAAHLAHGTTTTMASLVTAPLEHLERAIRALAPLVRDGVLAGVHLEGPYLDPEHAGAHDPALLREPRAEELARLLAAGEGTVRMVTLAPERPGALELVRLTVEAGAVAAVGHTGATHEQARAAFDAGARVATHLFNAMPALHHRAPGPVAAALEDERVVVELIADGVHVHDRVAALAVRAAGPGRVALVTDAMAAAGGPDGRYALGGLEVEVDGGVARLAGKGTLAGSTLTMDAALRRAVHRLGMPLPEAVRAASATPAAVLGLAARAGALAPGRAADLVVLDPDLAVVGVMARGRWITPPDG